MKKMNKKGDYKWGILINLILGLIILGISLYFIFTEFIIEEDINYELCRQSVVLRAQAIDKGGGFFENAGKIVAEEFPFKCQAQKIEIDYFDVEKATKEISDAIATCHSLYGQGKEELYSADLLKADLKCFQCARIHFSPEVVNKYGANNLEVGKYLVSTKFASSDATYFDYIYWNRPAESSREELMNQVVTDSSFNASNGDIIVMNYFKVSSALGRGWFSVVKSFQPEIKPEGLSSCDIIETIPA